MVLRSVIEGYGELYGLAESKSSADVVKTISRVEATLQTFVGGNLPNLSKDIIMMRPLTHDTKNPK